jgi:hypothetical protein
MTAVKIFRTPNASINVTGCINLLEAQSVRPFNSNPDCKRFEIEKDTRVYEFEAIDNSEMKVNRVMSFTMMNG